MLIKLYLWSLLFSGFALAMFVIRIKENYSELMDLYLNQKNPKAVPPIQLLIPGLNVILAVVLLVLSISDELWEEFVDSIEDDSEDD